MTVKRLRNYKEIITLSHKVTVYVPSESGGQPLSNRQEILDYTLAELARICGGATSTEALGYWQSPTGRVVRERVTLVYAFCADLDGAIDDVVTLVESVKAESRQESMAFEIDGELYLI